jgi:hypothetical protein
LGKRCRRLGPGEVHFLNGNQSYYWQKMGLEGNRAKEDIGKGNSFSIETAARTKKADSIGSGESRNQRSK